MRPAGSVRDRSWQTSARCRPPLAAPELPLPSPLPRAGRAETLRPSHSPLLPLRPLRRLFLAVSARPLTAATFPAPLIQARSRADIRIGTTVTLVTPVTKRRPGPLVGQPTRFIFRHRNATEGVPHRGP